MAARVEFTWLLLSADVLYSHSGAEWHKKGRPRLFKIMSATSTSGQQPPTTFNPMGNSSCHFSSLKLCVAVLAIAVFAGCKRDDVQVYEVPKEKEMPAMQPSAAATGPAQIKWQTPAGWTELPAGQMRVASFSVKNKDNQEAQTSIIPLPNLAGKDLENVNRWRGQIGLEPINASILATQVLTVTIAGMDGHLYDMAGTPPDQNQVTRILGAILNREGMTWFIKMTGPDALVASQKSTFIDFLKTLSFAAAPQTNATAAPPRAEQTTSAPATVSSAASPSWKTPESWKQLNPGPMQVAKFQSPVENGASAEITVAVFPGDVGGTLANVNRWRGQIGLPAVQEADLAKVTESLDLGGNKAILVDMISEQTKTRMIAAIVPKAGQTWFYKLLGQDAIAGREKDAFLKFVQSAQ
jgi:hypothetical protein